MGNIQNDITVLLGSQRYKGAPDRELSFPVELIGDRKELIESDRIININQSAQAVKERQSSNIFRISGKITNVFDNILSGKTSYDNYKNFMYLTNPQSVIENNTSLFNNFERVVDSFNINWGGIPQYHEFDFIRTDYNNPHINFIPESATTYNWGLYLSFPFSSDTQQKMSYVNNSLNGNVVNFVASDGIPFTIINTVQRGINYVTFRCGAKHNLTVNQYVKLSFDYNGENYFKVDLLGEDGTDTYETSFSIINPGYTGTTFSNSNSGTFKRVIDVNNTGETTSRYYVRLHKVLTDVKDCGINKMGFELNPFLSDQKLEYSGLTPNLVERVSVRNGSQSYSFNFNPDFHLTGYTDNNLKPLSEVYLTVVNKGYYGWFNPPLPNTNKSLQYGWEFNFDSTKIDDWWNVTNTSNHSNIEISTYTKSQRDLSFNFYYNNDLRKDDILVGDFCEYNDFEQNEYTLSHNFHKFRFNNSVYQIESSTSENPPGYYYQPFYPIKLRDFSSSLNVVGGDLAETRPSWAYYSRSLDSWIWREILPYGVIEESRGVDYPYTNDGHYTFSNILFLQTTPYRNINLITDIIIQPIKDNCE